MHYYPHAFELNADVNGEICIYIYICMSGK